MDIDIDLLWIKTMWIVNKDYVNKQNVILLLHQPNLQILSIYTEISRDQQVVRTYIFIPYEQ